MVWSRLSFVLALLLICEQAAAETVMLEFTSPTCGPCRAMQPVMQQLGKLGHAVREVDTSREPGLGLAKQFRVDSLPTLVVLVDGQERARLVGGGASAAKLVDMITTAKAIAEKAKLAAAAAPLSQAAITPTMTLEGNGQFPEVAADNGPQPGRVVPLDAPQPAVIRAAVPPTQRLAASTEALLRATVRVSIDDADGKSTGTGTIIDSREGKALVLTCGHLFRSSNGKGAIEISLFTAGPNGAELLTTVEGTLVDFDLDRDLALVCFAPEGAVAVAPVAPTGVEMKVGDAATAVGCAHGANPEPWSTQITAIDRYQGAPNIEAARAPVEGRSGGGLFNAAGQLVGVCNAADPQRDEGLYAALGSIRAKLDALQLAFVYQTPSLGAAASAATAPLAAATTPFEVRGQNPMPVAAAPFPGLVGSQTQAAGPVSAAPAERSSAAAGSVAAGRVTPESTLSPADRAMLEEINRRGAGAEVICIISPREPGGRSEVIKLDRASPALLQALTASAANGMATASAGAAGQSVVR
jgi:thiol-disulfide isomerase/thioredoxin